MILFPDTALHHGPHIHSFSNYFEAVQLSQSCSKRVKSGALSGNPYCPEILTLTLAHIVVASFSMSLNFERC